MEHLNKTESLRQALAILGPSTSHELEAYTGIQANHVSALLTNDLNKGTLQRGWKDKERCYGQPGSMKRIAPKMIRISKDNEPDYRVPTGDYYSFASQARSFEQRNFFDDAAPLWLKAAAAARHHVNYLWCKARAEYCNRGWMYPEGDE